MDILHDGQIARHAQTKLPARAFVFLRRLTSSLYDISRDAFKLFFLIDVQGPVIGAVEHVFRELLRGKRLLFLVLGKDLAFFFVKLGPAQNKALQGELNGALFGCGQLLEGFRLSQLLIALIEFLVLPKPGTKGADFGQALVNGLTNIWAIDDSVKVLAD